MFPSILDNKKREDDEDDSAEGNAVTEVTKHIDDWGQGSARNGEERVIREVPCDADDQYNPAQPAKLVHEGRVMDEAAGCSATSRIESAIIGKTARTAVMENRNPVIQRIHELNEPSASPA